MFDFQTIYKNFNYLEGGIWLIVAAALPFVFQHPTKIKKLGIGIASFGFIAFGISDFIEAQIKYEVPVWLLAYKVMCGVVILGGRYTYMGWDKFSFKDRCFLFGLFCLMVVIGIIASRSFP